MFFHLFYSISPWCTCKMYASTFLLRVHEATSCIPPYSLFFFSTCLSGILALGGLHSRWRLSYFGKRNSARITELWVMRRAVTVTLSFPPLGYICFLSRSLGTICMHIVLLVPSRIMAVSRFFLGSSSFPQTIPVPSVSFSVLPRALWDLATAEAHGSHTTIYTYIHTYIDTNKAI